MAHLNISVSLLSNQISSKLEIIKIFIVSHKLFILKKYNQNILIQEIWTNVWKAATIYAFRTDHY